MSTTFTVYPNGCMIVVADDFAEFVEWLRQAVGRILPENIEVRRIKAGSDRTEDGYESRPVALTKHNNPQATRILQSTLPLLEGGRCILLDGKPGVGKTTLAQIIARESGLGRTVLLDGSLAPGSRTATRSVRRARRRGSVKHCRCCTPAW